MSLIERNWRLLFALVSASFDATAIVAAGLAARLLDGAPEELVELWPRHLVLFLLLGGLFGLYRRPYTAPSRRLMLRTLKVHALSVVLLLLTTWLYTRQDLSSLVLYAVALAPAALLVSKSILLRLRSWLQASGWALAATVAVLERGITEPDADWLARMRLNGYDVRATVLDGTGDLSELLRRIDRAVDRTGAACIVVPNPSYVTNHFSGLPDYAERNGLTVRLFSSEVERVLVRAHVSDAAGVTIQAPERSKVSWVRRVSKRAFDLIGASALVVLASPLLLVVAIAVRLESKGPLLFRQRRALSPGAPPFVFYKFRSMSDGADRLKGHLHAENESSGALFKIRNDPRVTRVGRVIRRLSIDELPQLLNVLEGTMSLVGPRPLPFEDFARVTETDLTGGYLERRARSEPGIAGLWQISGRSDLGFREMVLLDLYYTENATVFFDLAILLHTIPVVLTGRGAY